MPTLTTLYRKHMPINLGGMPLGIPGCSVWYDGADSSTMSFGTGVANWASKGNYSNNLVQVTSGVYQPTFNSSGLNGLSTLSFAISNSQRLACASWAGDALTNSATLFIVFNPRTVGAAIYQAYARFQNDNINIFYISTADGTAAAGCIVGDITPSGGDVRATPASTATTGWRIDMVQMTTPGGTPTVTLSSNNVAIGGPGTTSGTFTTAVGGAFHVGDDGTGSAYCDMDLAEVIIYNSALSSANYTAVANYLSNKWALALGTPVY